MTSSTFSKTIDDELKQRAHSEVSDEKLKLSDKKPSYLSYLRNLHLRPDEKNHADFLREAPEAKAGVTFSEREHLLARKTWGDVVSETHTANERDSKSVKSKVIARLEP